MLNRFSILILMSIFFSSAAFAAVDRNIFKELCSKNLDCGASHVWISNYFKNDYYNDTVHKAFAIAYKKRGNKYLLELGAASGGNYSTSAEAFMAAMKSCNKEKPQDNICAVLFVNSNVRDQKLYKELIKVPKVLIPSTSSSTPFPKP